MAESPRHYRTIVFDSARWDGFQFRADDIVISTPPKCGTTWTQMMCALLIFQTTTFDQPMDLLSPWLDMLTRKREDVIADLESQQHRRFIKTHTPLDGLPFDDRVTYICVARDPRDVALSWDNHMANTDLDALFGARQQAVGLDDLAELMPDGPPIPPAAEVDRFWAWMEDDTSPTSNVSSLRATIHHLATFWAVRDRPNVVLMHYDDLKADLAGEMGRLADRLGITVPDEKWPALVDAATFERMRERADEMAPDVANHLWLDNRQFFHRGSSGQWRALLDDAGQVRYEAALAALDEADPELVAWVHTSPLADAAATGQATSP